MSDGKIRTRMNEYLPTKVRLWSEYEERIQDETRQLL